MSKISADKMYSGLIREEVMEDNWYNQKDELMAFAKKMKCISKKGKENG